MIAGITISDHRPTLISITSSDNTSSPPPFRYLNMWSSHPSYNSYIADLWNGISHTDPFIKHSLLEIKIVKAHRKWSWGAFGNVLTKVQELEEEVTRMEQDEQEGMKAAINIFTDGDRNTKFYHSDIKYKRKCNTISAIENVEGMWLHENAEIANDAVSCFKNLLNQANNHRIPIHPNYFYAELNYTVNLKLTEIPDEEEIWKAINSINSNKAAHPDGFTAEFYKKSWDIIKPEVIAVVASFFPRK
ncbi:uncharacterized protein LOC110035823 [Phalaenopsis equestris]|uniref:uncharacterized protein LOC110035823 n=1 Tax=Phalaenopsis equestris TaxID=78828 RepID=UPI0009E4DF30|nr:uncharacterized protein LOC110035823 [Phalaenopsis equestris]